jgi:hypothetical protein
MTAEVGYRGKTQVDASMFYAPYIPKAISLEDAFYRRAIWKLRFSFWPRRCKISNKLIWLKRGYEGVAMWTGPGDPVFEVHWHDKNAHMIYELKRQYGN